MSDAGRKPSRSFVVLDISSLDGQPRRIYGPFDSEREADAFGLAHVGHWTIYPLEAPDA